MFQWNTVRSFLCHLQDFPLCVQRTTSSFRSRHQTCSVITPTITPPQTDARRVLLPPSARCHSSVPLELWVALAKGHHLIHSKDRNSVNNQIATFSQRKCKLQTPSSALIENKHISLYWTSKLYKFEVFQKFLSLFFFHIQVHTHSKTCNIHHEEKGNMAFVEFQNNKSFLNKIVYDH